MNSEKGPVASDHSVPTMYTAEFIEPPYNFSENSFREYIQKAGRYQGKLNGRKLQDAFLRLYNCNSKETPAEEGAMIYHSIYPYTNKANPDFKTVPASYYYEERDLLHAIALAHLKNNKARTNELAAGALQELVHILTEKKPEDLRTDYSARCMLSIPALRRAMVCQFDEDLKKRLKLIWKAVHSAPDDNIEVAVKFIFEHLDLILMNTANFSSNQKPDSAQPELDLLEHIYMELQTPCEALRCRETNNSGFPVTRLKFKLPPSPEKEQIISQLKKYSSPPLKPDSHTPIRESAEEKSLRIKAFRTAYEQFLAASEPNHEQIITNTGSFLTGYHDLDRYLHTPITTDTMLHNIFGELKAFAIHLFNDITDQIFPSNQIYMDIFQTAQSSVIRMLLLEAHQDIMLSMRPQLSLIFQALTYHSIILQNMSQNAELCQSIAPAMENLMAQMDDSAQQLRRSNPGQHLLYNYEEDTMLDFIQFYNDRVTAAFHTETIDLETLKLNLKLALDYPNIISYSCNTGPCLGSLATIMLHECELLVFNQIADMAYSIFAKYKEFSNLI